MFIHQSSLGAIVYPYRDNFRFILLNQPNLGMTYHHRVTDLDELDNIVEQIKFINTRLNYLSVCKKLGIRKRIEVCLLKITKKNLIEKLPPLLDSFTFIPPYILDLI